MSFKMYIKLVKFQDITKEQLEDTAKKMCKSRKVKKITIDALIQIAVEQYINNVNKYGDKIN